MSQLCDLHTHSTHSDGTLAPGELVEQAWRAGITQLALTDHDSVGGLPEALSRAAELGMELLPGVELSVTEDGGRREMHILGFGIDPSSPAMTQGIVRLQRDRKERGRRMVERLNESGVELSFGHVEGLAGPGALGRPHVALALVETGLCSSVDDAFARYLRRGRPGHVVRDGPDARHAIGLIHEAGGIACLAHPPLSRGVEAPGGLDAFVGQLVRLGLDGLEIQHPSHGPATRKRLRRLARRFDLVASGGSDFHGATRPGVSLGRGRGNLALGPELYAAVTARVRERRARLTVLGSAGKVQRLQ
ncbi:MAG: PHP domain-containing protein [Myxococcota bacterium]